MRTVRTQQIYDGFHIFFLVKNELTLTKFLHAQKINFLNLHVYGLKSFNEEHIYKYFFVIQ